MSCTATFSSLRCETRLRKRRCLYVRSPLEPSQNDEMRNEHRNSILRTGHYPDLGSASDWLKGEGISIQPIRSTT